MGERVSLLLYLISSHLKLITTLTVVTINEVGTCSSILTRMWQTLVNLHLTVPSKVTRLTGAEVVIEMILEEGVLELYIATSTSGVKLLYNC